MNNRAFTKGLIVWAAGLLPSCLSSFLKQFTLLGTATDFARGLFDGLAVAAFGAAIVVLARSRRSVSG